MKNVKIFLFLTFLINNSFDSFGLSSLRDTVKKWLQNFSGVSKTLDKVKNITGNSTKSETTSDKIRQILQAIKTLSPDQRTKLMDLILKIQKIWKEGIKDINIPENIPVEYIISFLVMYKDVLSIYTSDIGNGHTQP